MEDRLQRFKCIKRFTRELIGRSVLFIDDINGVVDIAPISINGHKVVDGGFDIETGDYFVIVNMEQYLITLNNK